MKRTIFSWFCTISTISIAFVAYQITKDTWLFMSVIIVSLLNFIDGLYKGKNL